MRYNPPTLVGGNLVSVVIDSILTIIIGEYLSMIFKCNKPNLIRVYSLPRSGSNFLAAILHNHPGIFSLNSGGGSIKKVFSWEFARRRSIYPRADLRKTEKIVNYWLLDELKLRGLRGERRFILHRDQLTCSQSIVNLRNPFGVLSSMHKFHKKYNQPAWDLTEDKIIKFAKEYKNYLALARSGYVTPIYFDSFIEHLDYFYLRLCDRFCIDYKNEYTSFQESISDVGCQCGGNFTEGMSNEIIGGFFAKRNISLEKPSESFYCTNCNQHVLGFGGFNPKLPIDIKRMTNWKNSLDDELFIKFKKILTRYLGEDTVKLFLSSDLSVRFVEKLFVGR